MALFRKRQDRQQWPSTVAQIDEFVFVSEYPDYSDRDIDGFGAFVVNGEFYSTRFSREFPSSQAAETFAQHLKLDPKVTVRYNPVDPSDNFVEFPADNEGTT